MLHLDFSSYSATTHWAADGSTLGAYGQQVRRSTQGSRDQHGGVSRSGVFSTVLEENLPLGFSQVFVSLFPWVHGSTCPRSTPSPPQITWV